MSVIVRLGGSGAVTAKNLRISTNPTKTAYNLGESLNLSGMVVQVTYADGSTHTVSNYTTSPANGATLGKNDTRVIVTYTTDDGEELNTYLAITVKYATKIAVTTTPKTAYNYNDSLVTTNMVVKATYNDGTTGTVTGWTVSPAAGTKVAKGTTNVAVSATVFGESFSTSYAIFGKCCTQIEVTTMPTKTAYNYGQKFASAGLVVRATYNDGTTANITPTLSPANNASLKKTDKTVTVSYTFATETKTTTFNISVKYCTNIAVTTKPTKTAYTAGDQFKTAGMVVTAYYNDGTTSTVSGWSSNPANNTVLTSSMETVTVTATVLTENFSCTTNITVKYVTSISVVTAPTKTHYIQGIENLNTSGLVVRATYNDNTTANITGYTTSPANGSALTTANTSITISYVNNGATKTCSQAITVINPVVSWASGTASQISNMFTWVDNGRINLASVWAVGDERSVHIAGNINETVKYVIIDLGTDGVKTTSGGTSFHALVGQKNCLATTRQMNSTNTNEGGYNATTMKTFIDGDYTSGMSAATTGNFYSLVKQSSHKHNDGGGVTTAQTTSNVRFILHSEYEIFGSNTYASNEDQYCKHIEYYKTASNRLKTQGESGSSVYWWLRTCSNEPHEDNPGYYMGNYYGKYSRWFIMNKVGWRDVCNVYVDYLNNWNGLNGNTYWENVVGGSQRTRCEAVRSTSFCL